MIIDLEKLWSDIEEESKILSKVGDILSRINKLDTIHPRNFDRIILVGCGDSYFTALFGSYLLRKNGLKMVQAENSYEYLKYYSTDSRDLLIAISASGYTKTTVEAAKKASSQGATVLGFTCNPRSPLARHSSEIVVVDTRDSVASPTITTFGLMLTMLLFAYKMSGIEDKDVLERINKVTLVEPTNNIANSFVDLVWRAKQHYFLGSGPTLPLALIGMAKLRELNIGHSHSFELEEFMHYGNIPLGKETVVVILADKSSTERYMDALKLIGLLNSKTICFGLNDCDLTIPFLVNEPTDVFVILHVLHVLIYHLVRKIYGDKVIIKHGEDIARLIRV